MTAVDRLRQIMKHLDRLLVEAEHGDVVDVSIGSPLHSSLVSLMTAIDDVAVDDWPLVDDDWNRLTLVKRFRALAPATETTRN